MGSCVRFCWVLPGFRRIFIWILYGLDMTLQGFIGLYRALRDLYEPDTETTSEAKESFTK